MLARVVKSNQAVGFKPFSIPEIGEFQAPAKKVDDFTFPEVLEFETAETTPATDGPDISPSVEEILQNARQEAAQIIKQAEENSSLIEQIARDKALHEARTMVDAEVSEKVAELRGNLTATIERISALSGEIANRMENDLVKLALQISKKIVAREVTIDREIALTLVRVSLGKLNYRSTAEVRLNPEDLEFVEAHREKLDFRGSLTLVQDRSISPGGCLVHTETGDIDARIESQFEEIAQGLLEG